MISGGEGLWRGFGREHRRVKGFAKGNDVWYNRRRQRDVVSNGRAEALRQIRVNDRVHGKFKES